MAKEESRSAEGAWRRRLRQAVITVLIAVACLTLGGYVAVYWAERQILNTDNWVALVSPLPKQPVVSAALGSYITQQVFSRERVQARITVALPPRASFLAGPLTDQLQGLTTRISQKLVASDGFQTIWEGANRTAMNRLLAKSRGQTPPLQQKVQDRFNINLSGTSGQLRGALGKASEAIPALQPKSGKAITISADLQAKAERVRQVVRTIDRLAVLLPLLITTALLGSLALSRGRRRLVLWFAVSVFVVMLLELIALKWLRQQVLDQVKNGASIGAVEYVFEALVSWLKRMIYIVMALAAGLLVVTWLAGPYAWARQFRGYISLGRLQRSRAMEWWRSARLGLRRYEYYGWLVAGIAVLIGIAVRGTVTLPTIINGLLLLLSVFALLHIVATPSYVRAAASEKS